jgi:acylphosphatase
MKCLEIKVVGRVQGVGYRYFIKEKAKKLGITGYVKNEKDGSVKIICQGNDEKINLLLKYCKIGTSFSRVQQVDYHEIKCVEKNFFEIKI